MQLSAIGGMAEARLSEDSLARPAGTLATSLYLIFSLPLAAIESSHGSFELPAVRTKAVWHPET